MKADVDDLRHLPCGSILRWEFSHFVVSERTTRHGARIIDPAHGRRIVSMNDLRRAYTGVAIIFEPSGDFDRPSGNAAFVRESALLANSGSADAVEGRYSLTSAGVPLVMRMSSPYVVGNTVCG